MSCNFLVIRSTSKSHCSKFSIYFSSILFSIFISSERDFS